MHATYNCQIEEITQSIFATMLGLDAARAADEPTDAFERLFATIHISGASACSVVLGLSDGAARESAAAMLQAPAAEVTEADCRDVAAELVNMIGGNLKSVLPGPSYLSLPTVVAGNNVELEVAGAELVDHVILRGAGGPLSVRRFVQR
ncbi:MAG TPA: chemotaxis protein CheX [Lacipirellula sp.]